ncbi:hypothetical protein LSCM1_08037 [Leishmania martiniquensis]|uniref:Uncharacterized protein n=1 Tax=Leishmania martiniquensis TaxID=1580590 RepID=A0A836HMD8_9TRYP|nr:hypothetical protein LSCM1_08037 [Leishmania martiniquensis]
MGRRRKGGGRGNSIATAKDSPQDSETPTPTPTPPPAVIGTDGASATRAVAEAAVKPADPVTVMPSIEPAWRPAGAEVAAASAPNTADAVAALNAYAYQSTLNATAAGVVVEDDADDTDAAQPVYSTPSASAPHASGKKVAFVTSAATATPLHDEKLREARCVESACAHCAVM